MFENCITCHQLGKTCHGPHFITLNSHELLDWCKHRKQSIGMSNAKLSELSGVPKGTIDRLFSGDLKDYKYDTIRPIVMALTGCAHDEDPCGENELITKNGELIKENQYLTELLSAAKELTGRDQATIKRMESVLKTRGRFISLMVALCIGMVATLVYYFIVDVSNRDIGLVRDGYVLPLFIVVAAVVIGGVAMLIALLVGLFKDRKNRKP